jgi:hypothetical protein
MISPSGPDFRGNHTVGTEASGPLTPRGTRANVAAVRAAFVEEAASWNESRGWLNLSRIPHGLRSLAIEALKERDAVGFLCKANNDFSVEIVYENRGILANLGILEEAFVHAVTAPRLNNHRSYRTIRRLLRIMDRSRLRSAGDPLPGRGPRTLYRGVAGKSRSGRRRGYSWTSDPDRALWFATRLESLGNPAVFRAVVPTRLVLFYSNTRDECEFWVDMPTDFPIEKMERAGAPPEG